jgi:hypothetical protein
MKILIPERYKVQWIKGSRAAPPHKGKRSRIWEWGPVIFKQLIFADSGQRKSPNTLLAIEGFPKGYVEK